MTTDALYGVLPSEEKRYHNSTEPPVNLLGSISTFSTSGLEKIRTYYELTDAVMPPPSPLTLCHQPLGMKIPSP